MIPRIYAEYVSGEELIHAIGVVRSRGYRKLEAYSPYPVHGVDAALGERPSRLSIGVLIAGLVAAAGAYFLQWLLNAYLYPLDVGGRPAHFPLAFVPITFEMGVLFASLTAFALVMIGGRLFRLWHPAFEAPGFESASGTRFWLEVESSDPANTAALLRTTGARSVQIVEAAR